MDFLVIKIIDQDTFYLSPNWRWGRHEGNRARVHGIVATSGGFDAEAAKTKLETVLLGRDVTLENPKEILDGVLVCDVRIDGVPISNLLGERRNQRRRKNPETNPSL